MVGAECAAALVEGNPGAIVKGEPFPIAHGRFSIENTEVIARRVR